MRGISNPNVSRNSSQAGLSASTGLGAGVHNLNIQSYTINELYAIFQLAPETADAAALKRAKLQVLGMHPDKSRLPPDYFIFYREALDQVATHYGITHQVESSDRKLAEGAHSNYAYDDSTASSPEETQQFRTRVNAITPSDFSRTFNRLYDEHAAPAKRMPDNSWFSSETADYSAEEPVSKSNMNQMIDQVRAQQQRQQMVQYSGVQSMGPSIGTNLYDEDEASAAAYISSTPFSKLQYDDLRKVHQAETVFNVSESQFAGMAKYRNVEEYQSARGKVHAPMSAQQQAELSAEHARETERARNLAQWQKNAMAQDRVNDEKMKNARRAFMALR